MSIVDRCSTMQTRIDAAGIGWLVAESDGGGDRLFTHADGLHALDALAELVSDPAIRTIIVTGLPLAVLI